MAHIRTREKPPALEVDTVDGDRWSLALQRPKAFTMVVVYRGLHCPICRAYLSDLERRLDDFAARGVEVIAISADDAGRAATTKAEWRLERLPIGYGLSIDTARSWGLFISRSIKDTEPAEFAEPGLFLIEPGGTLYFASINSAPFARPDFGELLKTIDFVLEKSYPARGEA
jgi:peroxiredoxin